MRLPWSLYNDHNYFMMKKESSQMSKILEAKTTTDWDYSSDQRFVDYYANESQSEGSLQRFRSVYQTLIHVRETEKKSTEKLAMLDIGCGAGSQAFIWAEAGHRVSAIDVNEPLVDIGRERARQNNLNVEFRVGSATNLPWPDSSFDACVALELIEHIEDWQGCIREFSRVLRPGGLLCLSTTNKLCPVQQEFSLPFYSWYPSWLKRRYEKAAVTTQPELVNHATYPAVNWFSFYYLKKALTNYGYKSMDKFDCMNLSERGLLQKILTQFVRRVPALRVLAHVATPGTFLVAVKK